MKVRKKNGLRAGVLLLCLCFLFSALAVPTFADEVSTAPSEAPETSTAPSEVSETSTAPSEAPETSTVSSEVSETSSAPSEMPESTESKNSIVDSGTCGENVTWTLDENGVLTISGTGEMENFGNGGSAPWDELSVLQVNIEDGITVIGSDAFAGCSNLQKVSIPNSVQQINFRAFLGCKSLTSIEIPDSVTTVGGWAFESCGLSSVTLSSNLTSISWGMFASCKELTEIVIPDHITSIETAAFEWCNNLVEVKISENVTSIGEYAFAETGITSVVIPDSVQKIGDKAFSKCDELKDIKFEGNSPEFSANSFEGIVGKASYPLGNTTWTKEVMQDYGGTITWVAYDPDSGATSAPEPTEKPAEDLSYMLKIEGEDGIRITEGLKAAGVETPEQVKEKLLACVLQNEGYTAENTDLFEVTLRVSKDDGYTWGDVSADSFPESGEVRVTLPYPKGAPKDTPKENYKVYHMFTQDVNGHKAGEIEACPVEKIDEGLVVTLHGLSPVMVAWKPVDEAAEPTAAPSTEPTSAPSAEPTEQPKPTAAPSAEPTAAPTEQPAGDAPKTGDNGVHVLWIAAVLLSGGAMTALVWAKRKKQ